jgi:hypothetical protein
MAWAGMASLGTWHAWYLTSPAFQLISIPLLQVSRVIARLTSRVTPDFHDFGAHLTARNFSLERDIFRGKLINRNGR